MNDFTAELSSGMQRLGSSEIEPRVRAVEDLAHVMNGIVDAVLEKFAEPGPTRFLIYERLVRFGSLVIEPLEQLLWRCGDTDAELRVLREFVGPLPDRVRIYLQDVEPGWLRESLLT